MSWTNALLGVCAVLLVADFIVTRKWLRVSQECLRALEAQTKVILAIRDASAKEDAP